MAKFDKGHCAVGHKVLVAELGENNRAKAEDVAAKINANLGLSLKDREAWTPEEVRIAVRAGAFDKPGKREFALFRGRTGGICEVELDPSATPAEPAPKAEATTVAPVAEATTETATA